MVFRRSAHHAARAVGVPAWVTTRTDGRGGSAALADCEPAVNAFEGAALSVGVLYRDVGVLDWAQQLYPLAVFLADVFVDRHGVTRIGAICD